MLLSRSAGLLLACIAIANCGRAPRDPLRQFPRLMLWAWERPEDLRFLDPRHAGVASLAETVFIDARGVRLRPRLQPLRIAAGTRLMAVVRIEAESPAEVQVNAAADLIAGAARQPDVGALQLDYDARRSERPFYRQLAVAVRRRMPRAMPLTMTALVSWCVSDPWIGGLPVTDAVPMYFRMGPEPRLRSAALRSPLCQASTGLSTDELLRVPLHGRIFLFSPRRWTPQAVARAVAEVNRW